MILCLDAGNSLVKAKVFDQKKFVASYQVPTKDVVDEFALVNFFITNFAKFSFVDILVSSVVGSLNAIFEKTLKEIFGISPQFFTWQKVKGLKFTYSNPQEIGADILAGLSGSQYFFPKENIIVVDVGTMTTIAPLTKNAVFAGGILFPGFSFQEKSLEESFPHLLNKPNNLVNSLKKKRQEKIPILGKSTEEAFLSGLYYAQIFTIKSFLRQIGQNFFHNENYVSILTGGFAKIMTQDDRDLFTLVDDDLIFWGLLHNFGKI